MVFWYKNVTFTIFAPYLLLPFFFYKFATYLQGENLCKSILGLWYFQGYMFQPGIYGIIKWLFFNVKLTPNRYILHVPEGYRVISFLIWLFRSLHKITIVFFACLIVSISFRLFGCFFFLIQKIAEKITHGGFFFVISHLWYFLRDFWPYFFLKWKYSCHMLLKIRRIQAGRLPD